MMNNSELTTEDLQYHLPEELIAQTPLPERTASRLLVANLSSRSLSDSTFGDLPDLLSPGDLLVTNNTRVFKARLRGVRAVTGGRVEVFLLRRLEGREWKAIIRPGRAAKPGVILNFSYGLSASVRSRLGSGRTIVEFSSDDDLDDILIKAAEVPLPPYIHRKPDELDDKRYQTVFASETGAVAAPTAGLHFDSKLLSLLSERDIQHIQITLHVGPGTFEPLRSVRIRDNILEPEEYHVSSQSLEKIRRARDEGRRIVAVGTTTTRVLETIDISSEQSLSGETKIFIFPPYRFTNVDALITNFHLPGSSLLCLVAAFMGREFMMNAYRHAVDNRYRFYSYGDAMLIERKEPE